MTFDNKAYNDMVEAGLELEQLHEMGYDIKFIDGDNVIINADYYCIKQGSYIFLTNPKDGAKWADRVFVAKQDEVKYIKHYRLKEPTNNNNAPVRDHDSEEEF